MSWLAIIFFAPFVILVALFAVAGWAGCLYLLRAFSIDLKEYLQERFKKPQPPGPNFFEQLKQEWHDTHHPDGSLKNGSE